MFANTQHRYSGASQPASSQQISWLQKQQQASNMQQQQQQQNALYGAHLNPSSSSHHFDLVTSSSFDECQRDGAEQTTAPRQPSKQPELYSPSSSTSLLYHVYDQIHLPQANQCDRRQQQMEPLSARHLFEQQQSKVTTIAPHELYGARLLPPAEQSRQATTLARQQRPISNGSHHLINYHWPQQEQAALDCYATQSRKPASLAGQANHLQRIRADSPPGRPPLPPPWDSVPPLHYSTSFQQIGAHKPALAQAGFSSPKSNNNNNKWKRAQIRARRLVRRHSILLKCLLALLLLALCLVSALKILLVAQQQQQQVSTTITSNLNPLQFPPPVKLIGNDQNVYSSASIVPFDNNFGQQPTRLDANEQQDLLKSKLLIGEFVVSSQNYSHSTAHKTFLVQNLVKLIDQVFLSAQVRNVYSRTEVTSIRPNRSGGIIVDCNIILTDSIGYAAQMFGFALYDSLAKSNERLAGQPSFIVDKNSIRFNTVPDKDLKAGLIPAGILTPTLSKELGNEQEQQQTLTSSQNVAQEQQAETTSSGNSSPVVWSAWSQWSSCVDKNGLCDPGRLHSRLRKCVAQKSGEQVDAAKCRQRFSLQDQELQVSDCAQQCSESLMSDAPQMGPTSGQAGPQTAPSAVLGGEQAQALAASSGRLFNLQRVSSTEPAIIAVASSPTSTTPSSNNLLEQPARSCSNCTSDEICLLIEQQKVPFCAKIRDQSDECGGWCERGQLCQPLSEQQHHHLDRSLAANTTPSSVASRQGAFKCVHDSECLADEWRCQDSACIPLAKRCDGHSNCYDNSDERDCPPLPAT